MIQKWPGRSLIVVSCWDSFQIKIENNYRYAFMFFPNSWSYLTLKKFRHRRAGTVQYSLTGEENPDQLMEILTEIASKLKNIKKSEKYRRFDSFIDPFFQNFETRIKVKSKLLKTISLHTIKISKSREIWETPRFC